MGNILYGTHMRNIWETYGKHRGIWEKYETNIGNIGEKYGKIWKT